MIRIQYVFNESVTFQDLVHDQYQKLSNTLDFLLSRGLCSLGWAQTGHPPASAFGVVGLQACTLGWHKLKR